MLTLRLGARPLVLAFALILGLAAGCGQGKAEVPEKNAPASTQPQADTLRSQGTGLLPAETRVVMGVAIPKIAASPLGRRLAAELFGRDSQAEQQLLDLLGRCKIDPEKDIDSVTIGMAAGQDVALLIRGRLDVEALVACVKTESTANGGSFADKSIGGRTVYAAASKEGAQKVWFTFERDKSAIVSLSETWLGKIIDPAAPKIDGSKDIGALLGRVPRDAALWGTGFVPPGVGQNLVKLTDGQVTEPAQSVAFEARLDKGLSAELRVDMKVATDAVKLAAFARSQLDWLAVMAQRYSIGPMVSKIQIVTEQASVRFTATLEDADVKTLEIALAKAAAPSKNAPPEKIEKKEQSR
jgi:hypothetical protein